MYKHSKGFIPLIILLVISLFISFGIGYYAYKNGQTRLPDGDLANWKTVKDEHYNFIFKYPTNWTVEIDPPSALRSLAIKDEGKIRAIRIDTSVNLSMGLSAPCTPPRCQLELIEGNIGKIGIEWRDNSGFSMQGKDNQSAISFTLEKITPETKAFFRLILSTFKFLDQATNKRTVEVTRTDGTKTIIDLNLAKKYPDGKVNDDISSSWIEKTIPSPDESKIVVVTSDGGSSVYVVLLTSFANPTTYEEIGLNDTSLLNNIVWSDNSRYVTLVSRPADIGPYRVKVWDTQANNIASIKIQSDLLKDTCASPSLFNPKWVDNSTLQATYEAYYFVSDETCRPDPSKPIQKGITTITI